MSISTGARARGFKANKNASNQTGLVDGAITKVTFTTEVYDTDSTYDATTSIWTPRPGLILLGATLSVAGIKATTGGTSCLIYKNGAQLITCDYDGDGTALAVASAQFADMANGTDTYEIYCYVDATTTGTISGLVNATGFWGIWLGPG